MNLYQCNAQVMAAAQAVLIRRAGGSRGAAEKAVRKRDLGNNATASRRGVAMIYAIDEEIFANSLGMGLIGDAKKDCMGQ